MCFLTCDVFWSVFSRLVTSFMTCCFGLVAFGRHTFLCSDCSGLLFFVGICCVCGILT